MYTKGITGKQAVALTGNVTAARIAIGVLRARITPPTGDKPVYMMPGNNYPVYMRPGTHRHIAFVAAYTAQDAAVPGMYPAHCYTGTHCRIGLQGGATANAARKAAYLHDKAAQGRAVRKAAYLATVAASVQALQAAMLAVAASVQALQAAMLAPAAVYTVPLGRTTRRGKGKLTPNGTYTAPMRGGLANRDEVSIAGQYSKVSYYIPCRRGKYSCGNGTSIKPMPGQLMYWPARLRPLCRAATKNGFSATR